MQLSFYDASVSCYQQILESTAAVLQKGKAHAEQTGLPLSDIVDYQLHETMYPFSFQVISVWHHSYGAIKGMREGVFSPPPAKVSVVDYISYRKRKYFFVFSARKAERDQQDLIPMKLHSLQAAFGRDQKKNPPVLQ
ncbi:MAG: DUF1993 family protein [Gammaproteobacteria bacterium]|nr:DUF1993 family protein [Gammaproteobacteria bacterium]